MLINFSVDNFLSYKNENTLYMETGERLRKFKKSNTIYINNKLSLLKDVLIFGPNGSGKSNMLKGLIRMRNLMLSESKKATDEIPYNPFIMDIENENKATTFNIKFYYNDKIFDYYIKHDETQVIAEKLFITLDNKKNLYFERDIEKNIFNVPKELNGVVSQTRDNRLFTSIAQEYNDKICIEIMEWFQNELIIFGEKNQEELYKIIEKNEKSKKLLVKFLNFADVRVEDLSVRKSVMEVPEKMKKLFEMMEEVFSDYKREDDIREIKRLILKYPLFENGEKISNTEIDINMESEGTKKLIIFGLVLLSSFNKGKVIVMDEFASSLHLELAKNILNMINSNENNNQFILTTHELQLMDSNLRVDQICFVEKDYDGESNLYSLFDFKENKKVTRLDTQIFKRYLEGRFGSVPVIDSGKMLEAISELKQNEPT